MKLDLRVGMDVGGTNTDAVVLDANNRILARTKQATTADVRLGMKAALSNVISSIGPDAHRIRRIMLGTTHATNAILERRSLGRVAAIRLGAPASLSLEPMESWPRDLRDAVCVDTCILRGGHYVDGRRISLLDEDGIRKFLIGVAKNVDAVAITSIFSPTSPEDEVRAHEIVKEVLGSNVAVSLSHEIGSLGLLERENATILNAALFGVVGQVITAMQDVIDGAGLAVEMLLAQNDGTLMALDFAKRFPILTIGSGPANSLRGAAFLSGLSNTIVVDVGGTSTDFGVLVNGYPRESAAAVEIGGVRTNFRMPDLLSVAIGGGTIISGTAEQPIVGPKSVGYRLTSDALVYGGSTPTLSDALVVEGRFELGTHNVQASELTRLKSALRNVNEFIADSIDQVTLGNTHLPLVAVGGAASLIPDDIKGVSQVIYPENGDVANAIGAAIAWVSGHWQGVVQIDDGFNTAVSNGRTMACNRAIEAGADPQQVEVIEQIETPLSYLVTPTVRLIIKAAGPLNHL
ncbi:MAG: hypothetical protein RL353_609 [Actinomycetota bacterium]